MARPKGRNAVSERGLTNEQVVVLALFALGGDTNIVDTEDIAVKADEIAPDRFRWRKHAQYINIELVHTALRDTKTKSGLTRGAGSEGWQLTETGLKQVNELNQQGLVSAPSRRQISPKERTWLSRERSRLNNEVAFKKAVNGEADSITRAEAEQFFRLDEYVTGDVRDARIQRIINAFSEEPEFHRVVAVVASKAR
jgi:hypothetical protein